AVANAGGSPALSETELEHLQDPNFQYDINPANPNQYRFWGDYDYVDLTTKRFTTQQSHNIGISGGTENIRYRISGTWFNNDGMLKIGPDRNEKYTGRVNLDTRLNKYLNVSTNLSYSKNFIEKPAGGGRLEGTYGFLSNLFTYPGVTPLYDPNGHWAWGSRLGSGGALDGRNKIADVSSDAGINTRDQNNIRMNTSLEIGNFVEGLRFRLVGVIDANFNNTFDHNRPIPEYGVDETRLGNAIYSRNSVAKSNSKSAFKEFQFLTDYSKSFTNHAIHLLGGYSFQDYRLESFSVS